jgi:hypothetical protein
MPIHLKELIVRAFVGSQAEDADESGSGSDAPCDCDEPKETSAANAKMFEELGKMLTDKKDR